MVESKPIVEFAQRLNEALDTAGFAPKGKGRQNELARRMKAAGAEFTPRGVRKWLEGTSMPRPATLKVLAQVAKTTVGHLVGGSTGVSEAPAHYGDLSAEAVRLARMFDKLPEESKWPVLLFVQTLALGNNKRHAEFMRKLADESAAPRSPARSRS